MGTSLTINSKEFIFISMGKLFLAKIISGDRESNHCPYFDLSMYQLVDCGHIFIADPT
jgi:hypothetical protein